VPQSSSSHFRFMGLRPGCLVALVSVLLIIGLGGFLALRPVNEAKQLEQELLDRHGAVPTFIPRPDGAVAPDRVEVFLAVRAALLTQTGQVQETYARIDEAMNAEDLSAADGATTFKDVMKTLPLMVKFYRVRNGELMAQGMSLGEYFYIYAAAYGDRLCPPQPEGEAPTASPYVTARASREFAQILRNQLEATAPGPAPELAMDIEREIASLERGHIALPWQEGLPAALAQSLAPYRSRLAPLFCLATRELELGQKNKHPGGIAE
jgi:hypothetical protein